MTRELTKKEIQTLLADVFIAQLFNKDIFFQKDGKYKLNFAFTVKEDHLIMNDAALYRVKEEE